VTRRITAALLSLLLVASCAEAPEPGNLAAFCRLLGTGLGLSTQAAESDYAELALVAPPEIRPTIDALQIQARDFDELLGVDPPDLAALFIARFDPAAASERAALDRYAEDGCNLLVDRPPSVRWANFVRENHTDAQWRNVISTQFDVGPAEIAVASAMFAEAPAPMGMVEQVCDAMSDFLAGEGAEDAIIRVFIGTVVVLEEDGAAGPCQLP